MRSGEVPSFGPEESGISELERLALMNSIAARVEASTHELAASEINRDPMLHALLGKIVEGGAELDPSHLAHLRKILALRLGSLPEMAEQAAQDQAFFDLMSTTIHAEIDELNAFAEDSEPPEIWGIACDDLLWLESDE